MNARRPKRQAKQRATESSEAPVADALYVYGIGESEALASLIRAEPPDAIEPDAALDLVATKALAAVVSAVPIAEYGENGLQENLKDPTWLALRATRHEEVVDYFASRASLVPLRFGTIYFQRESIRKMLSQRETELLTLIEQMRGKEEWGVNIYGDRVKLKGMILSLSPKLNELMKRIESASPGEAYLLKKQAEVLRNSEVSNETRRVIAQIERRLEGECEGTVRLRVLKGEATERGEVLAKLACLVSKDRFHEFLGVTEELAGQNSESGFELELTGPWPVYNFAAGEL